MNSLDKFFPFLAWFRLVTKDTLRADLIAGFTGAVIVLPQGVAFATIAGLPPEYGLYTAMVTPIIAALFGSSRHLISGPTTAISIVVFSSVSNHAEVGSPEFVQLALTMTFLAGAYQFGFGLVRLGALVNFVSHTVVVGFTAGAALLIATSQMKNVLGIQIPKGESFIHTWYDVWLGLPNIQINVVIIALATLFIALASKKFMPKLPNLLIGLVAGTGLGFLLNDPQNPIALVGTIPGQLPPVSMPDLSLGTISMLAPEAFAVALLGLIEAVSISRAIATQSNQRIDANQEFVAQGLSNLFGSFFSSYAGSRSFTRSGVNYSAGAVTPMSAIFAAIFLMLIVVLVAPYMAYMPIAAMGGVILLVAYNLIDKKAIAHVLHASKNETAVLLTTFFATLFLELEFAIYFGVLLSLVLFLACTSMPEIVTLAPDSKGEKRTMIPVTSKPVNQCPQLKIIRIDMSVYFGSVNHIQNRLQQISESEHINHILIDADGINGIDLSGVEMLVSEAKRLKKLGGGLYFAGLKPRVYENISESAMIAHIGNAYFFDHKSQAIKAIYKRLDHEKCESCVVRVFKECEW
ncbi:MAG: SulP family inorganic anion transporter [Sedimenticolaceae bacterium]